MAICTSTVILSRRVVRFTLWTAVILASVASALPARFAQAERVVAIGDIHGDLDSLLGILQRAGIADSRGQWLPRDTTLVQTGDFLDRGPKSRAVMDLLIRLQQRARQRGSRAIILMGNHEAMNIYGDLRYVTPNDYASFADSQSEQRRKAAYAAYAALRGPSAQPEQEWRKSHPAGFVEHRNAFGPGGKYGRWLRTLPAVAQVDDTLFLHGGVSPQLASWSVEKLNASVSAEIQTFDASIKTMIQEKLALPFYTLDELTSAAQENPKSLENFLQAGSWVSIHPDGPLWFRGYAEWGNEEGAAQINKLALALKVNRFIVGHTPQLAGIRTRFGGKVVLIDTGMLSSYFEGGRASAVEIRDGKLTAIYNDRIQSLD